MQKKNRRVGLISLGCAKNRVDSEIMLGRLQGQGYELTTSIEDAETVIVNTCGFIEEARQESIDSILEVADLKKEGGTRLLVAGCMVNRWGQELAEAIPEIDGFVGLDDLKRVDSVVQIGAKAPPPSQAVRVFDHTNPRSLTTQGYAYLKVAEGCNNPCTFCSIPIFRGAFRSRTVESLVMEAKALEKTGIQELNLIAQDTTRFGEDLGLGKHGFLHLVEALLERTDIPWIRFLYAYPTTLDRDLLSLMGREERFCSYLDMPLQHVHPEILSAMRRGGSAVTYRRILERAREFVPEVSLRTTFMVGFPGETEEHYRALLDFVEEIRFDHLGAFVYSHEEDTPSARMESPVPNPTARKRYEKLLNLQEPISLASRQNLVGRRLQVLIEGVCGESEHLLEGRHGGMAPEIDGRLLINDGFAPAGTLVEVEITEAFSSDLVGHIVGPLDRPGITVADVFDG